MKLKLLEEPDLVGYRAFLGRLPKALFYHSLEFRELIASGLGLSPLYLVLQDDAEIRGALPCFLKHNAAFGNVINSLPYFGSNGGILIEEACDTRDNRKLLLDGFLELSKVHNCISATIITSPFEDDPEFYREQLKPDFLDQRIGQITELRSDNLEIYSPMRRRGLLKAQKSGIEIKIKPAADKAELARFYELHCQNMERIGGLKKDLAMLEALNANPCSQMLIATRAGEILAGLLCFYLNQTVEYYIPVFDQEHKNAHALALTIYAGMNAAFQNGYRYWNFGGTWLSQEGVRSFKQHFGAQDYPYTYHVKLGRDLDHFKAMGSNRIKQEYPGLYVIPFEALDTTTMRKD